MKDDNASPVDERVNLHPNHSELYHVLPALASPGSTLCITIILNQINYRLQQSPTNLWFYHSEEMSKNSFTEARRYFTYESPIYSPNLLISSIILCLAIPSAAANSLKNSLSAYRVSQKESLFCCWTCWFLVLIWQLTNLLWTYHLISLCLISPQGDMLNYFQLSFQLQDLIISFRQCRMFSQVLPSSKFSE